MSSEPIDAFACCARDVFTQYHLKNKELILTQPDTKGPAHVPKIGEMLTDNRRPIEEPALIIGGGVAGLYIAMMLESIKKVKIPFVIVEAKDHVGGTRCIVFINSTHR
jgi:NADPH-dependent 2,4-dienoyl-CoA reductase/sulfur reductase-like enzyme